MQFFDIDETKTIYDFKSGSYKKEKTLGEGAFGKVLLVQKVSPNKENTLSKDSYYFALKISKRFQKIKMGKNLPKKTQKRRSPKRNKFCRTSRTFHVKTLAPFKHN